MAASGSRSSATDQLPLVPVSRARRPRGRRRRVRRAGPRARGHRGRAPGAHHAGHAHAACGRGRRPTCSRPVTTARRCSRSTTPSPEELDAWGAGSSGTGRVGRLRVRAEDRRPRDRRSSTRRAATCGPRPGATASSARTSPPTSGPSSRCRCGCGGTGRPTVLEVRGEVYMPVKAFERAERGAQRGGGERRSPTRATPRPGRSARRTPRSPPSRPLRLWCHGVRHAEGVRLHARTRRRSTTCETPGFPVNPATAGRGHARGGVRVLRALAESIATTIDYEIDGVVVKVDPIAQQEELGATSQGPAVGHRVQVPAGGTHHAC